MHAHTPLDHEWIAAPSLLTETEKESFAESYVRAAVDAELAVVAITDHNFCREPRELLIPYIQKAAQNSNLNILPGFEITVSDCGGTHVLVVFSEKSPLKTIDELVSQLFPPGTSRFRGNDVQPTRRNINDLNQILKESQLENLMMFAHADREDGVLNHRGGTTRAVLWNLPFMRIAQLSKPPSEFTTGFISAVVKRTNAHYTKEITYIVASDCRCLMGSQESQNRHALGDCFTWVKADPTFEGLKQIVFEPNERTRFQTHKPDVKPAFLTIDRVKFIDSTGTFQNEPIPLNSHLTAVIGGKSTGKSLLLSCIAQSIDREQAQENTEIAKTNLYDLDNIDFEVTWSNGDVTKLSKNEKSHHITFLPQTYIHRLVDKENRSSLTNLLLRFLRQNGSFETAYSSLVSKRDAAIRQIAVENTNFSSHLSSWRDVVGRITELGDKSLVESEIERVSEREEELRKASGFSEEEAKQYKQLLANRVEANTRHASSQRIEAAAREFDIQVPQITKEFIDRLNQVVSETAQSLELEDSEVKVVNRQIEKLKESINTAESQFKVGTLAAISEFSQLHTKSNNSLNELATNLKPFVDKVANQKELKELQELKLRLTSTLKEIGQLEKEKSKTEERYWASINSIKKLIKERFEIQERFIKLLNDPQYADIGDETIISASMTFSFGKFETEFMSRFDMRHSLSWLSEYLKDNKVIWSSDKHVVFLNGILQKLIETDLSQMGLRANQDVKDMVGALLHDYLSHTLTVKQSGEDIFNMSPGKQGLILLEIFLNLSNSIYPIILDQPEDNLDNRTIYSHLVNYLKSRKLHRQIIMATHNPNLVLGADAEQIIVANQDDQAQGKNAQYRFEYVSGRSCQ